MITTFALLIFFFNLYQQHANYGLICVRLLFFFKFLFYTNTIIITFICKCIKYLYSFNQGLLFQIKTHSVYLIPAPPHISQPAARPHARYAAPPLFRSTLRETGEQGCIPQHSSGQWARIIRGRGLPEMTPPPPASILDLSLAIYFKFIAPFAFSLLPSSETVFFFYTPHFLLLP